MKARTVIVLESNQAVLEQLKTAFNESKDFTVLHAGDDGDVGVKEILSMKPDLVLVGMFLKGTDGCGVIRAVKKTWSDAKIVATGISNDTIIETAMEEGACYYLVKPFSMPMAMERIRELMKDRQAVIKDSAVSKRSPITIEEKISEIFISIGISKVTVIYGKG